jgi:hypothetical protein
MFCLETDFLVLKFMIYFTSSASVFSYLLCMKIMTSPNRTAETMSEVFTMPLTEKYAYQDCRNDKARVADDFMEFVGMEERHQE